jgi:hypothetical protein
MQIINAKIVIFFTKAKEFLKKTPIINNDKVDIIKKISGYIF